MKVEFKVRGNMAYAFWRYFARYDIAVHSFYHVLLKPEENDRRFTRS